MSPIVTPRTQEVLLIPSLIWPLMIRIDRPLPALSKHTHTHTHTHKQQRQKKKQQQQQQQQQ